jgi:hypothetical protein
MDWTSKGKEMTTLTLNRKQVDKLVEIVTHFHEIELFTIDTENKTGIGDEITVSFQLFDDSFDNDAKINITDIESW